jgi:hypothetical protein
MHLARLIWRCEYAIGITYYFLCYVGYTSSLCFIGDSDLVTPFDDRFAF